MIWGAFHWVALAGNADAPLAYMAVSTLQLTAVSVIMTFVFNGSRESVPVVALMHAMYDTVAIGMAPLVETGMPLMAFSLTAIVTWVIADRAGRRDQRHALQVDQPTTAAAADRLTVRTPASKASAKSSDGPE